MPSNTPHMPHSSITQQRSSTVAHAGLRLGERLRQLRVSAGMTQTELAGERFSKEYVSQIERGKTRPTRETVEWLAQRLGVDAGFLANGVSADERGRVDAALARAEAMLEARRNAEAIEEFEKISSSVAATGLPELEEGLNDRETTAHVFFQASIIADREGHWVLARSYAERARAIYEELSDRQNLGRLMNNLGGINFLLGHPDEAISFLKDAFRIHIEIGNEADAAHDVNSLAQVHLRTGDIKRAEEQARHALQMLGDRVDFLDEIGNAQLVLGRALLEQERLDEAEVAFRAAEDAFDQLSSASHRASAWVAQGDLATRRGDDTLAARLYRNAAEALQDVRF